MKINTPQIAQMPQMPPWVYRMIILIIVPLGFCAIWVNREYQISNLMALKLDDDSFNSRKLSIDLLFLTHIAALFITPLLAEAVFKYHRVALIVLGMSIWAYDGAVIFQARFGIMLAGESTKMQSVQSADDLRTSIKSLRESAAGLRTTAQRQMQLNRVTPATASQKEAAALERRASDLADKLANMPVSAGVTEVGIWKEWAPYKAGVESLLISFTSLIMFILSGVLLRTICAPYRARWERAAPALSPAPAPAPVSFKAKPADPVPAPAPAPKWWKTPATAAAEAAAAATAATAAGAAHAAGYPPPPPPPLPETPSISVPAVPRQVQPAVPAQVHPSPESVHVQVQLVEAAAPAPAVHAAPAVPAPAPKAAPAAPAVPAVQVKEVATVKPVRAKKVRVATPAIDGAKMDSGTEGKAAGRYQRIKDAVIAGLTPSIRSFRKAENCGDVVAKRYLVQLESEGVIERQGQGWVLTKRYLALLEKVGV